MTSLGEVQRIIGLSLSKIQMGRNQRGGLPLHKNLLVATVLNKARDVYMQETMYMNYRLMACGQFNQEEHEDIEDDDTPDTEDYEEDSESDVEDDNDNSASKEYCKEFVGPTCVPNLGTASSVGRVETPSASVSASSTASSSASSSMSASSSASCCLTERGPGTGADDDSPISVAESSGQQSAENTCAPVITNDEGFIDESDCDCDTRNFSEEGETRVPFQYCFSCAPFHPSNGRGPTLVGPQLPHNTTCASQPAMQEPEDKLIYDMDSKSTQNQSTVKRKRQISSEETVDAINSILPKKRRDSQANEEESLDDSGFQEEEKVFHPAFRDQTTTNGMEVDQITSLVSIFSFGQQLFNSAETIAQPTPVTCPVKKSSKDDDDSDSDSDTSSDSGHSSDDHETNTETLDCDGSRSCLAAAKESDLDVTSVSVAAAV